MRFTFLALLVVSACAPHRVAFHVEAKLDSTLRHTRSGDVVGGEGRYGSHAWLGIPFAAPPVGPLRWRAPQAVTPWVTPREALTYGAACPQFASPIGGADAPRDDGTLGEEDCLTLNVFAPRLAAVTEHKLPVMVWIHGGGNSIGTAQFYEGGHLATAGNVIVVTIQYRLGPLGWFHHAALRAESNDPLEQSGNFGTLDQIAALEWVRDNIEGFGGDASNVTIFGESAGGFDVYALLVSPRAKGLFHRAITQSGGLSRVTTSIAEHLLDDPEPGHRHSSSEIAAALTVREGLAADRAGATRLLAQTPPAKLAELLRRQTAGSILTLYHDDNPASAGMLDMPLVVQDGALLPTGDWLTALSTPGGWNEVPVIAGTNRDEAKLFLSLDPRFVWRLFGVVPRMRDENTYQAIAQTMSHTWKSTGADQPVQAMLRSGAKDIYSYRFDWAQEPTVLGTDLSQLVGAAHGLEVPFVFGHFDLGRLGNRFFTDDSLPDREALSAAMMGYWSTFARTGQPGNGGDPKRLEWHPWDASSPDAPKALVLDAAPSGGLRVTNDVQSTGRVIAELQHDARLAATERCELARRLVSLRWLTEQDIAPVCAGM